MRRGAAAAALALLAAAALLWGAPAAREEVSGREDAAREITAAVESEPESDSDLRRVPFAGILGLDGWYEEETFENGVVRHYVSSDCVWLASSDGDDYVLDLDGDGVTELICNNGDPDWYTDVEVYRRSGNFIQEGLLFYDTLDLPGRKVFEGKRGKGQISSRYDPERGAFVVTYATEDGEAEYVFTDYGPFDFDYLGGDVHGIFLPERAFSALKADGTFSWTGGASHWGFAALDLTQKDHRVSVARRTFACCENGAYVVGGERATEAAFREAVQRQDAKEDAAWYAFTDENIHAVLGEET